MDKKAIAFISFIAFAIGCFYLAVERDFIIIRFNNYSDTPEQSATLGKKQVHLYYWNHNKWINEPVEIIWSSHINQTIIYLLDAWFTLMEEEKIIEKKVSVQSALFAEDNKILLLSLDYNPFSSDSSTFDKWMIIEGILKTLRDNGIKVQGVKFLVHHHEIYDYHLDFSNPWPAIGFAK
jgi:hypothetical protein